MQRAVILIGVHKTGKLQPLQAVSSGVQAMKRWAEAQGIGANDIITITDDSGPVTARDIKHAVRKITDRGTCEQLIVYFAGHGVNIRYGEYWLLSGAPDDTQEAVNVEGSVVLARQCGIPHVVFISDACRTAAEGVQAQYVTGSEIFPNEGGNGPELPVDLFFACTLGKPALEIKNATVTAGAYHAVYTDALVAALDGKGAATLLDSGPDEARYVRPRPLKRYLSTEVVRILSGPQLPAGINQTPDARITSDETAWLARFMPAVAPAAGVPPEGPPPIAPAQQPSAPAAPPTFPLDRGVARGLGSDVAAKDGDASHSLHALSQDLLRGELNNLSRHAAIPGTLPPPPTQSSRALRRIEFRDHAMRGEEAADTLLRTAARIEQPFGPTHFESGCGFKVRGQRVIGATVAGGSASILDDALALVRVPPQLFATNVVLRFADDTGVVLPAIANFIAELTFDDNELVNVTYEPSENSPRWINAQHRLPQLRKLRAVIASSAQLGVFHLEGDNAQQLAREMQLAKGVDPTMAIYAAYAYDELQQRQYLSEMQQFMRGDLGFTIFDVALLARALDGEKVTGRRDILPPVPLLSQGWSLLAAHRVELPGSLRDIRRHLKPSLWTLFDSEGVEQITDAIESGEIQ